MTFKVGFNSNLVPIQVILGIQLNMQILAPILFIYCWDEEALKPLKVKAF